MMINHKVRLCEIGALAACLVTAACTEPAPSSAKTDETAAEATGLPEFAPRYPGSTIKTQETDKTVGDLKGTMVVLETPDSVEKVIGFYDARAKSAGVKAGLRVDEDDSAVRIYESGGIDGKGGMISVGPGEDGKTTTIVITAGQSAIAAVQRQALPNEVRPRQMGAAAEKEK